MIIDKNKYNFYSNKKAGFTVVEIMIAIVIFGIATLAILTYFTYMVKIVRNARNTTIASNLAQGIIDEQMAKSYDELAPVAGAKTNFSLDPTNPFYPFQYQLSIILVNSNLSASETDVGLKQINTIIYWPDGSTEKNITMSGLISQR